MVGQLQSVALQLRLIHQQPPWLRWLAVLFRGSLRRLGCVGLLCPIAAFEQLQPVDLSIRQAAGLQLQALAGYPAQTRLAPGQIQGAVADLQTLQLQRRLAGTGQCQLAQLQVGIAQPQLGGLGQIQFIAGIQADIAAAQIQWQVVTDIGPEGAQVNLIYLKATAGFQWQQAHLALPGDSVPRRARGR